MKISSWFVNYIFFINFMVFKLFLFVFCLLFFAFIHTIEANLFEIVTVYHFCHFFLLFYILKSYVLSLTAFRETSSAIDISINGAIEYIISKGAKLLMSNKTSKFSNS